MALAIGESPRAGDASEEGDVRSRRAPDQQHQRDDRADHHAAQQALTEHADDGRHGHDEFRAIAAPEFLEGGDLEQARHRHQHDRRQHRLGQRRQQVRKEKHDHQNNSRRDGARQRRARAPAFVDQRLRHAAADRETAAQPGGEVGRGERKEFLVRIQPAAMLGREHATDRGRLHRAEQEARERQRQQVVPQSAQ